MKTLALAMAATLLVGTGGVAFAADGVTPVAVLDLAYIDTSGEPTDQAAVHEKRAADFVVALKRDLAASGRYRIVPLTCGAAACASDANPAEVRKAALAAGVKLIVLGAVHKMSTLIEWVKIDVDAVDDDRIVYDKLLTFRGDTDEAWAKAEQFGAAEILKTLP